MKIMIFGATMKTLVPLGKCLNKFVEPLLLGKLATGGKPSTKFPPGHSQSSNGFPMKV